MAAPATMWCAMPSSWGVRGNCTALPKTSAIADRRSSLKAKYFSFVRNAAVLNSAQLRHLVAATFAAALQVDGDSTIRQFLQGRPGCPGIDQPARILAFLKSSFQDVEAPISAFFKRPFLESRSIHHLWIHSFHHILGGLSHQWKFPRDGV